MKPLKPPSHPHRILLLSLPKNVRLLQTTGNETTGVQEITAEEISGYEGCHLRQAEAQIEIVMADGKVLLGGDLRLHHLRLVVEDEIFPGATIGRKRSHGLAYLPF